MSQFYPAAKIQDIPEGEGVECRLQGRSIAIFKVNGQLHAINNLCPHRAASLVEGELKGTTITCPLHAWKFDITNGQNVENPASKTESYLVKLEKDDVMVELP